MDPDRETELARLRAENARLRALVEAHGHLDLDALTKYLREVFWVIDASGRLTYVSPSYEQVWGRDRADLARDSAAWIDAVHPHDRERVAEAFRQRRPGEDGRNEYRVVRPDGEVRWIHDRFTQIPAENGGGYRTVGVAEDVTAKVLAEQRLRERDDELARVLRLGTMGEMAANIAHELNQPLAAILTHAEVCHSALAAGKPVTPELLGDLEDVILQAERAGRIIRQVRHFVRRQEPERRKDDLNRVVREALGFFEPTARMRHTRMEVELAPEPLPVQVDEVQIQQVILNLARNAVEAYEDQDPHRRVVRVSTREREDGCEVRIEDDAKPLSPREVETFFEPFRTSRPEGLGMGLSISRTLVEAHGGVLRGEPCGDRGLRVSFTLPMDRGSHDH